VGEYKLSKGAPTHNPEGKSGQGKTERKNGRLGKGALGKNHENAPVGPTRKKKRRGRKRGKRL